MKKKQKILKKFKNIIDRYTKELKNNSDEIEDILKIIISSDKKTLNSKYKADLLFIQNTLQEIENSVIGNLDEL